jgi:uncharacterized membrane protein
MDVFGGPWGWMYWNLTLAVVPMVLALVLFRQRARTGVAWWLGVTAFVLFLPNGPYVLTDIQHYAFDVAMYGRSETIAHYAVLFAAGLGAYVVAIWRCSRFLFQREVRLGVIAAVDVAMCALCSLGVYIGRVHRFNSWDIVRAPQNVVHAAFDGLSSHLALAGMGLMFTVITVGTFIGVLTLESIAAVVRSPSS